MQHGRQCILETLQKNRECIQAFDVRRLGLLASCARDEHTPVSDIDSPEDFEAKTFDNSMDLKMFLEGIFNCRFDLVLSDAVKPALGDRIRREAVYVPGL